MGKNPRTVVEIPDNLHLELRKQALLSDLRIYQLANAIIENTLKNPEKGNELIKALRIPT
jgi:hypothetical protein